MLGCGVDKKQDFQWRKRHMNITGESVPLELGISATRKAFLADDHLVAVAAEDHPETEIFKIKVHYIILATGDVEDLNVRIKANHEKLNLFFAKRNSLLAKVPDTSRYPFHRTIGNPGVQFSLEGISVKPATYQINGIDDVRDNETIDAADIHVFVADEIASGKKSGESYIGGNMIVVFKDHVGSPTAPGPSEKYGRGHTLVHEMGHCLGLPHNFDEPCNRYFDDLPVQRHANFLGELGGPEGGQKDNKWYACDTKDPHPLHKNEAKEQLICGECGGVYEAFMNIMDYGDNSVSAYFSEQQAIFMRKFLVSDKNVHIDFEISHMTLPPNENDEDSSIHGLSTGTIIGISVAAAALVVVVALIIYYIRRRPAE